MQLIVTFFFLILIFSVLVFVHELGHFLASKRAGVLVDEFAFGFGPKILSIKIRETLYRINVFPFGGYVKMLGDEDASSFRRFNKKQFSDEDIKFVLDVFSKGKINLKKDRYEDVQKFVKDQRKVLSKEDYAKLKKYFKHKYITDHPGNYDNISFTSKVIIMVAGVTMNFILAIFLFYIILSSSNYKAYYPEITKPMSLGASTNNTFPFLLFLSEGDKDLQESVVLEINGKQFTDKASVSNYLKNYENKSVKVKLFSFIKLRILETDLVLNGNGIASNFDADLIDRVYVSAVSTDSIAAIAGLKADDGIISLAENLILIPEDLNIYKNENKGKTVEFTYFSKEKNQIITSMITIPDTDDVKLGITSSESVPFIEGLIISFDYSEDKYFSGAAHAINMAVYNGLALGAKFKEALQTRSVEPVTSSVGSIVAVTEMTSAFVKVNDFKSLLDMTAMLSVTLAIINILPIPLMDGGHLMFIIIEKLRGRPISEAKQEKISIIAFWGLIILTILVVGKDIIFFDWPQRIYHLITGIFK